MSEEGLLLLGGGGHCRAVLDVLRAAQIPVAGIVHGDDAEFEPIDGAPPLGRDADLPALREQFPSALVSVGQIKTPAIRIRLFNRLRELDFLLPKIVSTLAYVSPLATIGDGTVVMHNAMVNVGASVAENCIVNTKALIEHECRIAPHCHIAVGAVLCGNVSVGEGSFIGAGAVVREGVQIGCRCVVGCGMTVLHDLPTNSVFNVK